MCYYEIGDVMFKLDNKGWGLIALLVFLIILFIAIYIICLSANNLGID